MAPTMTFRRCAPSRDRYNNRIRALQGRIRGLGTPEEVRSSDDPVLRGFIEGRPETQTEAA